MFSPWILSLQLILFPLFWRGIYTTETNPPLVLTVPVTTVFKSAVLKGDSLVEKVEILKPIDLELACTWTGNPNKLPNITGYWRKDGSEITNSRLTVQLENEQYNLKRVFRITGDTLGNYSCIFSDTDEAKIDFNVAAPEMDDKKDKPIVAYVGDSVAMACKTKLPPNTWLWYRANGTEQELINATTDPLRYKISVDGNTTKLTVMNLTEEDSGVYVCSAIYNIKASVSRVEVRVITFMEPLKPFIAIVAEVIILVLLILLYERWSSQRSSHSPTENGVHAEPTHTLTRGGNNGMDENTTTRQRKI
ncbi:embigin isoform X1 [Oncorhynchus keta]|uniref:embigin isoform X1 n=1 Tax=Oncorhynchus keta TaxID=8018 RepID=UPI0015F86E3C|nr:embigin isoform X1 [Oncorhynchus keta]XP_052334569.1 embigin isoform X1 [Oncorhynchus keta]